MTAATNPNAIVSVFKSRVNHHNALFFLSLHAPSGTIQQDSAHIESQGAGNTLSWKEDSLKDDATAIAGQALGGPSSYSEAIEYKPATKDP